jgi:hypothetical protein
MRSTDEHSNDLHVIDGILRGSTGVPVDDGSQAFKNHIHNRIEASYDRSRIIPLKTAMTILEDRHKNRYS